MVIEKKANLWYIYFMKRILSGRAFRGTWRFRLRYRFILLDVDGTLLDFKACEAQAFRRSLQDFGLPYSDEVYETYHKLNAELWKLHERQILTRDELLNTRFVKLFEQCGYDADGVDFERNFHVRLSEGAFLEPGAIKLLERLKVSPCETYIVTNGTLLTQERRLRESGIEVYAKKVFISEEIGCQKPLKEYFDCCFAQIPGFAQEDAIIVGDSLSADIQGGINAGIATCWYNPERKTVEDVVPDFEAHSLDEVWQICSGENGAGGGK